MGQNYIPLIKDILSAGISQSELARRLGVTFAALSRWLHGHAAPRPSHRQALDRLHRELVAFPTAVLSLHAIAEKAEALKVRRLWAYVSKHSDLQDELILEHTYHSTSIEGTTFTKRETEAVLFDHGIIPDKSLAEHLAVTNHAAALKAVLRQEFEGPVSEELIYRLHAVVMQGIREDAGHYSKHHRAIRGLPMALTHPDDIPEEMGRLIREWSRTRDKTIVEIAKFHADFELIHPFGDGNGRVGRLVMAIQCLERDYPPVVVETERKGEYYEVLEYAQKKSEGPLAEFLVGEMEKTLRICRRFLK
jgi:Fic family protein